MLFPFSVFCPCKEARANLSEEEMQRGIKRIENDDLRRVYLRNKGYNIDGSLTGGESVREEKYVRNHVKKNFPFKLYLKQKSLSCKCKFSNFPPISKIFIVNRADIGDYMRELAIFLKKL